jgi:very-short-patch-repair endonuclease
MSRRAHVPPQFRFAPFRGSKAIADGLLTHRMLDGPTWRRMFRDVYLHTEAADNADHRTWCEAAALYLPAGGAIAGLSAAYLWGVDLLPRDAAVTVTVAVAPPTRTESTSRLSVQRCQLPATDVTRFGGLPLTTGLRTAFDLGRGPSRTDALVALDALAHRRVVKLPALRRLVDERAGWPGVRRLRDLLPLIEPLTESPMETRLRLLLHDAGLPRPVVQHEVRDTLGRFMARLDFAYPRWLLGIEYEGDHHRERAHYRQDVARLNALRSHHWLVLRFTADDVLRQPATTVRHVAAAIQERHRNVASGG